MIPLFLAGLKSVSIETKIGKTFDEFRDLEFRIDQYKQDDDIDYIIVVDHDVPENDRALLYSRIQDHSWTLRDLRGPDTLIDLPDAGISFPLSRLFPSCGEQFVQPADYVQTLKATFTSLQELDIAAKAGDKEAILRITSEIDWAILIDEMEPVVYRKYEFAIWKDARRAIRNLRRPYLQYLHCVNLSILQAMMNGAIRESPSLLKTADQQVADAWRREEQLGGFMRKKVRDMPPIETFAALRRAIAEKLAAGHALDGVNDEYGNCGRVPYQ